MPRLDRRLFSAVLLASLAPLACPEAQPPRAVAMRPSAAEVSRLSGTYEVRGLTVQALSGRQREVSGTLRLDVAGARYQVAFELDTMAPDFEEPVAVVVHGTGRGLVIGDVFTGTTEEWMTLEPPESLDELEPRGVELPAKAGRRIVSTSRASFDAHGTLQIVMQNYPGRGERYEASMTVLEGRRAPEAP